MKLEELPPKKREALKTYFEAADIKLDGPVTKGGYDNDAITVSVVGELLFENARNTSYGLVLYSEEMEIVLKGVIDGRLILEVNENE